MFRNIPYTFSAYNNSVAEVCLL